MTDHLDQVSRWLCLHVGVAASVARVMLIAMLSASVPASAIVTAPSRELMALNSVYYTALWSGRDPDAAVRKARYIAHVLVHDLGVTQSAALTDVTQFALRRGGVLCGGL